MKSCIWRCTDVSVDMYVAVAHGSRNGMDVVIEEMCMR